MSITPLGTPGMSATRTAVKRNIFKTEDGQRFLPHPLWIDGSKSRDPLNTGDVNVLRAGLILGKITSSKKLAPSIIGVTTNAEAIGSTSIEAAAAVVTELVRRIGSSGTFILQGPPVANGTVASQTVTYSAASGTTITCAALTLAFVAGSFIMPSDGSATPLTVVPDSYGIKVTDEDEANQDVQMPLVPIAGLLDSSQLINWPSDTGLQDWLTGRLGGGACTRFMLDHVWE